MTKLSLNSLDPRHHILIKGARLHNLKNIDVAIPRNSLCVITGLSGSGKSSLAFDTLYAEGQRRYVESLSSYARQFLGKLNKPEVEYIKGISPAVAIEQKVNTRNPRSTVGTSTEIYEYLKLLYARIGRTISPVSGEIVKRDRVSDIVDFISNMPEGSRVQIFAPFPFDGQRSIEEQLNVLIQQGYTRARYQNENIRLDDNALPKKAEKMDLLIDRLVVETGEKQSGRMADSVQIALHEGKGYCFVEYEVEGKWEQKHFSSRFELDGISFEEPSPNLFTFNNPYGACKSCEGFGTVIGIDPDQVIPDKSLSVYEEAVACWKGEKMSEWKDSFIRKAVSYDFPVHRPYYDLSAKQKQLLWEGKGSLEGINAFFKMLEENTYKIQYRVMLSRYRGKTICPECNGSRLRKDASYVKIQGQSITDLVLKPIDELFAFFKTLKLDEHDKNVAKRLLIEIENRLAFLGDVGLGYLTLNRLSNSLSGGESQRINLATSLGSSLVGSMYILDEPSIGLHSRDTQRLIKVLKRLRDSGNTVIVVEHDEEIIRAADHIIDIGPLAGRHGGEVVFEGTCNEMLRQGNSLTAEYLNGKKEIALPDLRRKWNEYILVEGATEHNLKRLSVKFPLNTLSVICGVSGSGKSTLVSKVLFPALKKYIGAYGEKTGAHKRISGSIKRVEAIEYVNQNPIGRSSRSNPATYVGAYDDIRTLYSQQALARTRSYKPGFFSFNVPGGRCDECEGEGLIKIEMQFMADVLLPCESCHGTRFKEETLEIKFREKDVSELLKMTILEAMEFFSEGSSTLEKRIVHKLKPLVDVGLGYLQMGQASSTLSGGEAQRIKLASFLIQGASTSKTLFIFDEPTTGLHFHDINNLLSAFNALIDNGHSIIVIEHNAEVIKSADWVIELGPEGGEKGGYIVFEGSPEELAKSKKSPTAALIRKKLKKEE